MPVGIRSLQIGITDCHDQCAHWSRNDRGRTKLLEKLGLKEIEIILNSPFSILHFYVILSSKDVML